MHTAWKAATKNSQVKKLTQKSSNMSTAQCGSRMQRVNAWWIWSERGHLSFLSLGKLCCCKCHNSFICERMNTTVEQSASLCPLAVRTHGICHTEWRGNETKNSTKTTSILLIPPSPTVLDSPGLSNAADAEDNSEAALQMQHVVSTPQRCNPLHWWNKFNHVSNVTWHKNTVACRRRDFPTPCQRSTLWGMGVWFKWNSALPCGCAFGVQLCQEVAKSRNLSNGTWNVRADRHKIVISAHGSNINIESISLVHGMCCLDNRQARTVSMEWPVARLMISSLNLRVFWKPVNPQDCVWEKTLPNHHEDHTAGKGDKSLQNNIVQKFTPMPQAIRIPEQRQQRTRNGRNWKIFRCHTWRKSEVRKKWSMKQGRRAQ